MLRAHIENCVDKQNFHNQRVVKDDIQINIKDNIAGDDRYYEKNRYKCYFVLSVQVRPANKMIIELIPQKKREKELV